MIQAEDNKKFESTIKTLQEELYNTNNELEINKKILFQNSKMAVMGEMMDAVAHQWIQPLNVISMRSEFLNIYINEDGLIEKKHLKKSQLVIKQQIDHLTNTLHEFRNFFRPNYHIKQVSLQSILDSISILLKDELIKNNTKLNIKNNEDILIRVNENDIKHILINLINNAKDEMIDSGIKIDNRIITISYSITENKDIEILVKDNGNGIPKTIINNIFKPNFTTKKETGGTGIGLYMCRQMVNKYNGKIDVYNNNGAIFRILLRTNNKILK